MIFRTILSIATLLSSTSAFSTTTGGGVARHSTSSFSYSTSSSSALQAAESEVAFGDLDGSELRIGVLRTRWNDEHVSNLVEGIKAGVKECKVSEENIFIKEVPGAYELPYAAKLLAMSGTVDAIICTGVLIKGETLHFEYISDAVTRGIMDVSLGTNCPVVYGVLNCLNEEQVVKRSSNGNGGHNHGEDWGKTAVEMAIMRAEALKGKGVKFGKAGAGDLSAVGFGSGASASAPGVNKEKPGFF
jgi:6,7-dimethyl-8-ribityllumazine synthase